MEHEHDFSSLGSTERLSERIRRDPWIRLWAVVFVLWFAVVVLWPLLAVDTELEVPFVVVSLFVLLAVLLGIAGSYPTPRQEQTLTNIAMEYEELDYYRELFSSADQDVIDSEAGEDGDVDSHAGDSQDSDDADIDIGAEAAAGRHTERAMAVDSNELGSAGTPSMDELVHRLDLADEALKRAHVAVHRRDYVEAQRLQYEASRQKVLFYGAAPPEESDRGGVAGIPESRAENLASRLRSFAADELPTSKADLVEEYLDVEDQPVTPRDLYRAVEVMHEWNVSQDAEIRRKLRYLRRAIGLLVLLFVGFGVLAVSFEGLLELLFFQVADFEESGSRGALVLLVLLVGGFGAVFSVLFSVFQQIEMNTTDPSIPGTVFVSETLLLRVLVGSMGALVLVVLFQGSEDVVNPEFLLRESNGNQVVDWAKIASLAFLSGFSERFLKGYLDDFVSGTAPSED